MIDESEQYHATAYAEAEVDDLVGRRVADLARRDVTARRDDAELLQQYCDHRCHRAFETLVERHTSWVLKFIRRRVKDPHLAEDVTQAVFLILARKARSVPTGRPLSAWLFQTARFAANDACKHESRHRRRVQRFMESREQEKRPDVDAVGPELDQAIARLSESDRQAILLRFFEDKSMAEMGEALGISEVTAKKRVSRALQRLRKLLEGEGIRVTSLAGLAALLANLSRPETARASMPATPSAGALRIADATVRHMSLVHLKLLAAMGAAGALVLAITLGFAFHAQGNSKPSLASSTTIPHKRVAAQVWIGAADAWAWSVQSSGGASSGAPLPLRSGSHLNLPVAIVRDSGGGWWARRLEPDVAAALRLSYVPPRAIDLPSAPAPPAPIALRAVEHVLPLNYILPLDDKNFELLPFAANTASDGHLQKQPVLTQWQQIDGPTESPSDGDSVVALRQFAGTNPSADDSLPGGPLLGGPLADDSESIPPVSTVPEPASIALISCIFLALRRRR